MPCIEAIEHKAFSGQQGAQKVCARVSHQEQRDHREAADDRPGKLFTVKADAQHYQTKEPYHQRQLHAGHSPVHNHHQWNESGRPGDHALAEVLGEQKRRQEAGDKCEHAGTGCNRIKHDNKAWSFPATSILHEPASPGKPTLGAKHLASPPNWHDELLLEKERVRKHSDCQPAPSESHQGVQAFPPTWGVATAHQIVWET